MKKNLHIFSTSLVLIAGTTFFVNTNSSSAHAESISFVCNNNNNGTPTTFVITENGQREFIRWVSEEFVLAGYGPLKRCQEVSARMNQYSTSGKSKWLTHGTMNNQPVICLAEKRGGSCSRLLYTLKKGQDARETVRHVMQLNRENFSNEPRLEAKCRIYIDIRRVIEGQQKKAESVCRGQ